MSIFLTVNLARIAKRNQLNLKLLYSLQFMSYFASITMLSWFCTLIINPDNIRPLQINYFPENTSSVFIRTLYTSIRSKSMENLPNSLLVLPVTIAISGFIGVISLYGWRCGNGEKPTNEIEWDAIKIKKKMNAVKDLRIDDVMNFFHEESDQDDAYSLKSESFVMSEVITPNKRSVVTKSIAQPKQKKEGVITQQYVPEEDDTRKLIEGHFRGKAVNINFDKERGEILIKYCTRPHYESLNDILFGKHMIYLLLSFMFSSVTPISFLNKLERMLLAYLYNDEYTRPAMVGIGILSGIALLGNILLLNQRKSKKFMIINYTVLNYLLILLFSYLAETLPGSMFLASASVFLFVYMKVLMFYIVSYIVPSTRMIVKVLPVLYSVFFLGNIIKVFVVDPNRGSFQLMVFVFLIIQGMGFLFITGVDLKKIRQAFLDYAATQEKNAAASNSARAN